MSVKHQLLVYNFESSVNYVDALEIQKQFQAERIQSKVSKQLEEEAGLPDVLMLVEHPRVYTLGSSSSLDEIYFPFQQGSLDKVGDGFSVEGPSSFEVRRVQRGGKITYHCPGQLVGYVIFDLSRHRQDIEWFLRTVEAALVATLAELGVAAHTVDGLTGVWVGGAKVAAVGVSASRWVTMHGFALNIDPDMSGFGLIVPCGIRDRPVASLRQILAHDCPPQAQVRAVAARAFQAAFGFAAVNRVDVPAGGLPALTAAGGSDLGPGRTAAGSP